jgi:hypothetical protein
MARGGTDDGVELDRIFHTGKHELMLSHKAKSFWISCRDVSGLIRASW